ncbi:MAG: radical SAM protein [Bacillota bacterium]
MSEEIRIDSHKLIFHPDRVASWLKGDNIYPIYAEIAPSGTCNHRCIFCALDYMEYKPILLDKDLILSNLKEMAHNGLKSVMYAGEGEPMINKNTPEIVNKTKQLGIDVAMTTNGVLFTKEAAQECLESFTWIRFSLNAGNKEAYGNVHRTKEADFDKVIINLEDTVELKRSNKLQTTIGVQLLLIPDNFDTVFELGVKLKRIGVDYYTIKPYSQHPLSINKLGSINYNNYLELDKQLKELQDDSFKILFRANAMKKLNYVRQYNRCLGLPFWSYIDANAGVWACSAYLGNEEFYFGNLKEQSFSEIWQGEKRKSVMNKVSCMDTNKCREICRLDEINMYLDQLKNPSAHVNFI